MAELLARLATLYQAQFQQLPPPRPAAGRFDAVDYNNRGNTYAALQAYEQALADFD